MAPALRPGRHPPGLSPAAMDGPAPDPAGGRPLCRVEEIPDGQARGFDPPAGVWRPGLLVLRRGDTVRGYVNACPHQGVPLNWLPDRFMTPDGRHLQCTVHGARFRPEDGVCVAGPCLGDALEPVALAVDADGLIRTA